MPTLEITLERAPALTVEITGTGPRGLTGARGERGEKGEPGERGVPGPAGAAGAGVPAGGLQGMVLRKRSAADYDTEWALNLTPIPEDEIAGCTIRATYNAQTDAYTVTSAPTLAELWEAKRSNNKTIVATLDIDNGAEFAVSSDIQFCDVENDSPGYCFISFAPGDFGFYQLFGTSSGWQLRLVLFTDVSAIAAPASASAGQVLAFSGTEWTAQTLPPAPDLSGYAAQSWVQNGYQAKAIADAGGYFTSDTVEGALQELGAELANIAGKADKTPRIAMTGADTAPTLDPNKLYVFLTPSSMSTTSFLSLARLPRPRPSRRFPVWTISRQRPIWRMR